MKFTLMIRKAKSKKNLQTVNTIQTLKNKGKGQNKKINCRFHNHYNVKLLKNKNNFQKSDTNRNIPRTKCKNRNNWCHRELELLHCLQTTRKTNKGTLTHSMRDKNSRNFLK